MSLVGIFLSAAIAGSVTWFASAKAPLAVAILIGLFCGAVVFFVSGLLLGFAKGARSNNGRKPPRPEQLLIENAEKNNQINEIGSNQRVAEKNKTDEENQSSQRGIARTVVQRKTEALKTLENAEKQAREADEKAKRAEKEAGDAEKTAIAAELELNNAKNNETLLKQKVVLTKRKKDEANEEFEKAKQNEQNALDVSNKKSKTESNMNQEVKQLETEKEKAKTKLLDAKKRSNTAEQELKQAELLLERQIKKNETIAKENEDKLNDLTNQLQMKWLGQKYSGEKLLEVPEIKNLSPGKKTELQELRADIDGKTKTQAKSELDALKVPSKFKTNINYNTVIRRAVSDKLRQNPQSKELNERFNRLSGEGNYTSDDFDWYKDIGGGRIDMGYVYADIEIKEITLGVQNDISVFEERLKKAKNSANNNDVVAAQAELDKAERDLTLAQTQKSEAASAALRAAKTLAAATARTAEAAEKAEAAERADTAAKTEQAQAAEKTEAAQRAADATRATSAKAADAAKRAVTAAEAAATAAADAAKAVAAAEAAEKAGKPDAVVQALRTEATKKTEQAKQAAKVAKVAQAEASKTAKTTQTLNTKKAYGTARAGGTVRG